MTFATITCFVQTLVQMCNSVEACFRFPSRKLGFIKGLCVAIERLVPGTYFTVKNCEAVPPRFRPETTGRRSPEGGATGGSSPEGGTVNPELTEYFHGTTLQGGLGILSTGFKTGLGAGSDELWSLYGVPVPGVYVARTFTLALTYPQAPTTPWLAGHGRVSRGTVPSLHHSCPLRIVFRMVANQHDALWRKKDGRNPVLVPPRRLAHHPYLLCRSGLRLGCS